MVQDIRFALRFLKQRPLFTVVAVLALTLGIGSNTAIFSVVRAVLLRPLPFPSSEQLMLLWETQPGVSLASISAPDYQDIRDLGIWEGIAAYRNASFHLGAKGQAERVIGAETTASFFDTLKATAELGRTFSASDERTGAVVLSHKLWMRMFGGAPSVVGRSVMLDGQVATIVGVMGPEMSLPRTADVWVASRDGIPGAGGERLTNRGNHYLRGLIRLRPEMTLVQAQARLHTLAADLGVEHPESNGGHSFILGSFQEQLVGGTRPALFVLLAAVMLVLLIACANVANLLLARAATRQRELAIRVALGASRSQLIRQLLTESVVLSLLGGGCGVLLAFWGVDGLIALAGRSLPRAAEVSVNGPVLLFSTALAVGTGLVFGIAPAWVATSLAPESALKDGGRGGDGRHRHRLRSAFVVAEVAIAVVLLAGAGLMIRSFWKLSTVDAGFVPESALTLRVSAPPSFSSDEHTARYFQELDETLSRLPGVTAAGATGALPLSGSNTNSNVIIDGRPVPTTPAERIVLDEQAVTPGYFKAMGMRLLEGRGLTEQDGPGAPKVMVVNQTAAATFFPGQSAIGKRISFDTGEPDWVEIVGVVADVRHSALGEPARPGAYYPHRQHPWRELSFVLRTQGDLGALAASVRTAVAKLPPGEAAFDVRPLQDLVSDSLAPRRFTLVLLLTFAVAALLLAGVGVYGVMSYSVAQRTRELGVRLALGAKPSDVLRMVLRQGLTLTGTGLALGLGLALSLTRLLSSLLYGVAPYDPGTLFAVAGIIGVAALTSSLMPALAATRVDPMSSLRAE